MTAPHRLAIRAAASIVVAVMTAVTGAAHAQASTSIVYSTLTRTADSTGIGEALFASVSVQSWVGGTQGQPPSSAIRPNGQSDWPYTFGGQLFISNDGGDGLESWLDDNSSGLWQFTYANGASGSFDTSSIYIPAAERRFLELTSASASLFEDIKANGLTGTFTFHFTEPFTWQNGIGASIGFGTYYQNFNYASGVTSVTFDIVEALGADDFMYTEFAVGALASGDTMYHSNVLYYGYGAVPAPGALALLGLAGLAGRRRR